MNLSKNDLIANHGIQKITGRILMMYVNNCLIFFFTFLPPMAAKLGSICRGFLSPLSLYNAA